MAVRCFVLEHLLFTSLGTLSIPPSDLWINKISFSTGCGRILWITRYSSTAT